MTHVIASLLPTPRIPQYGGNLGVGPRDYYDDVYDHGGETWAYNVCIHFNSHYVGLDTRASDTTMSDTLILKT